MTPKSPATVPASTSATTQRPGRALRSGAGFAFFLAVAITVGSSLQGVGSVAVHAWPGCDGAAWQLCPNEYLEADQFIESEYGDFDFGLGCLNEYTCWVMARESGSAIWFDDANDGAPIIMQSDGNLVVYDDSYSPEWATNTDGNSGAWFQIQNDGNAVVYPRAKTTGKGRNER